MTFFGALYKLFIGPLELFFEIVFVIANRLIGNLGLSIIVLSLVMNFLVLPLYKRADAMQEEQRETEKRLKKWVTHIKKTFKGDERFMMLQTYYRQNNYKPSSILKGSVSLLLEIPFFIAAYNFLSHAGVFNGFSFGPFVDMGKPDGLIKIAGLSINLLPILMTTINIISSMIYTKGLPTSSKVQLYGMAGIFLILLYNSPAALVFYWTLNNLFSLVKNLFYKMKNPKFVFGILSSVAGVGALIFVLFIHNFNSFKKNFFVIAFAIIFQFPLIFYYLKRFINIPKLEDVKFSKNDRIIFYLSVSVLTVLTGVLIPSAVIKSSPEEFINTFSLANPLLYVLNSLLLSAGTFLVWFNIFYILANKQGKKAFSFVLSIVSFGSIINYLFFGNNLGTLSSLLQLDNGLVFDKKEILINILVFFVVLCIVSFVFVKKIKILKFISLIFIACLTGMSIFNCVIINNVSTKKIEKLNKIEDEEVSIPLSRSGKNVMIIMMDRAISSYIPYIFNEKPEVAKQFEGFTYYPNTISFGGHTIFGLPGIFGGYEYTPAEMNKRDTETLKNKHNEAMKVLPVLFADNDYSVTIFDPTYAGYDWIPDLSIYDEYPNFSKHITMDGSLENGKEGIEMRKSEILNRNFFVYSLSKTLPLFVQPTIYDAGNYNKIDNINQAENGIYKAIGENTKFNNSYGVLKKLPSLTKIEDCNNTFFMMCNETSHSPCLLQEPEYEPKYVVDNTDYETLHSDRFTINGRVMKMDELTPVEHYQVNMASMIQLGNYFDFLRDNGVFDNTKIIIVSDHGFANKQFEDLILGEGKYDDIMLYNPVLLVKDFDSNEYSTDYSFMTNADVPTIATNDLISNPINPFTKKVITSDEKFAHDQYVLASRLWKFSSNSGTTFQPAPWYLVHDNVLDVNNWKKIEESVVLP